MKHIRSSFFLFCTLTLPFSLATMEPVPDVQEECLIVDTPQGPLSFKYRPLAITKPPLHRAAIGSDLEKIENLFEKGSDLDLKDPQYGNTALMYAIFWRVIPSIALLLDLGANVNIKNNLEQNVFHYAAIKLDGATLMFIQYFWALPNRIIDINDLDKNNMTALDLAIKFCEKKSKFMNKIIKDMREKYGAKTAHEILHDRALTQI